VFQITNEEIFKEPAFGAGILIFSGIPFYRQPGNASEALGFDRLLREERMQLNVQGSNFRLNIFLTQDIPELA